MKQDSGAVEFNAVLLLFFIGTLVTGGVLFAVTGFNYLQADTRDFNSKESADKLLDQIIEEMQSLSSFQFDYPDSALINELIFKYEKYNLDIADVSSGYHLDFLSDADISDKGIIGFIFKDGTGITFNLWLKENGLTVDKEQWREFIKEEAWNACVSYGWIHRNDTASFAYRSVTESFGITSVDLLFPLVNNFPRMNVNMVNPDILNPLLSRKLDNVEKQDEKVKTLINRMKNGPVTQGDISSILTIPLNHPLMSYLGTKTAFWKLIFSINNTLKVEAIVAAIPKKNGAVQEIESYKLINRSFIVND